MAALSRGTLVLAAAKYMGKAFCSSPPASPRLVMCQILLQVELMHSLLERLSGTLCSTTASTSLQLPNFNCSG